MCRSVIAIGVLVVAAGCGGNGGNGADGGNGFNGSCCLNNVAYTCPTQQAYTACIGFDPAMCHANCGADIACNMQCDQMVGNSTHDASQCNRNPSGDGMCNIAVVTCMAQPSNPTCTNNGDCASGNCTQGHCYGNSVGDLCNNNVQCLSGNCTQGCCQDDKEGSACSSNIQCTSGNCTQGKCEGTGSGSPCDSGSQCSSGQCTGGVCA